MNLTRRETFSLFFKSLVFLNTPLILACGGGESFQEPANLKAEQCDYKDPEGITHRYFRGPGNTIYYATSKNGLDFEVYPYPVIKNALFPVLVFDQEILYLVVKNRAENKYNLFDVSEKTNPVFIKTILQGNYFNVAFAVIGDRWHSLIESKAGETFYLLQSYSDWPELDFNTNLSGNVINDAGNPTMKVIWIDNTPVILALFGADYKETGVWRIKAATLVPGGSWQVHGVVFAKTGVHEADPDFGVGEESYPMRITVGDGQDAIRTLEFNGTPRDLLNAILDEYVEFNDLGVRMR